MRRGRTEMTPSTRRKPGPRSDNEGNSKSSSSRKQTTKQRIEKAKNALMSSDEENDDVEVGGRKTAVAAASAKKNNHIAVIQAKNKELEAEIKLLNDKDKDWEALNADNVDVISELRERVATLNEIASNLEADVRVAQGHAQHAQNNSIDTTIEMDAIEYDRVCSYVRKTMFRKVKFTLDKALDSVQKGSIGGAISEAFNINEDERGQKMYEDNNGIMPTLGEVLLLCEEPIWDPEDDHRI
eukprot:scaffold5480_cov33-Attheya_sp.AAC.2